MSMNMFGGHMVPGISVVVGFGPSESATWRLGTSGYVVWPLGAISQNLTKLKTTCILILNQEKRRRPAVLNA